MANNSPDPHPKKKHRLRIPAGFRRFCDRHHFGVGSTITMIVLFCIVILLGCILIFGNNGVTKYTSRTIDFGLDDIGELATQAGYYTNVNTIQKPDRTIGGMPIPGTSSKAIMTYGGVIRAGLDFDEIQVTVDDAEKTVTLSMPATRILSNEIDIESCEIYDEQNSIFNRIDISNYNQSLAEMKTKAEEQAITNKILDAAKSNAEVLVRSMFKKTNATDEYTLIFVWREGETE